MYLLGVTLTLVMTFSMTSVSCDPLRFRSEAAVEPEVFMNATQLITSKGYPCDNHYVTTEDGYILNVLRIPHGRKGTPGANTTATKPVVFLQHGLMGDCTNWITNPANESLAFILADRGADVYLGNNRGNLYSLNHTSLNTSQDAFWAFSFDEFAQYDLPAMINFARNTSKVDQVYYAGHSQGTTIGFIKFGEDQEFAKVIKHFFALAPVARVANSPSPFEKLAPFAKDFFNIFGHKAWALEPEWLALLQGELCQKWLFPGVCSNILFIISGFDAQSLNETRLPVYMSHVPSSTSVQNQLHWAQEVLAKQFQKYDYYSPEENMKHYNQTTPPLYDPSKCKVPVTVLRGGHDWQSDEKDNEWLLPQLNVTRDVLVKHYEHLDFIWALDAAQPGGIYQVISDEIFKQD